MLVRIGVVALAGLLGVLGSLLITRDSHASDGSAPTDVSTTAGTTTAPSTAVSTSTAPASPPSPPVAVPVRHSEGRDCGTVGGVIILVPGRRPVMLNPIADRARMRASTGAFVFPSGAAVVTTEGVAVRAGSCRGGTRTSGRSNVASPSLFGGVVTAARVSLTVDGRHAAAVVTRLRIGGKPVVLAAGARAPVAGWGYATKGERRELGAGIELQTALAVHLLTANGGLPSGAIVAIGFSVRPKLAPAAAARPGNVPRQPRTALHARSQKRAIGTRRKSHARHRHVLSPRERRRRLLARLQHAHRPLTLTPKLGLPRYVFPVAGPASFGDSYGAARSDVSWHHGDDIFAPLGTPVVAVADGTLNRVGWERLGGWRLWVRDRLANEFYYAHLSGYTGTALRGTRVRAGQVLGYVGDTGDAFGTPFHLHFEIHPRSLLSLRYDGAVDPTTYLEHWQRLSHVRGSRPLHPALPTGAARAQAFYVYRELLASRGLIRRRPSPPAIRPRSRAEGDVGSAHAVHRVPSQTRPRQTQKAIAAPASTFTLEGIAVAFLATSAALATTLFRRRSRWRLVAIEERKQEQEDVEDV
jgi:murein DD-endopeptidase MepM/ murein hydrolase activator NlpD